MRLSIILKDEMKKAAALPGYIRSQCDSLIYGTPVTAEGHERRQFSGSREGQFYPTIFAIQCAILDAISMR